MDKWSELGSPQAVLPFQEQQKVKLEGLKQRHHAEQARDRASLEEGVASVAPKIQVKLMVTLMRQAGLPMETINFFRTAFTHGVMYVGDVPFTGLYPRVPLV